MVGKRSIRVWKRWVLHVQTLSREHRHHYLPHSTRFHPIKGPHFVKGEPNVFSKQLFPSPHFRYLSLLESYIRTRRRPDTCPNMTLSNSHQYGYKADQQSRTIIPHMLITMVREGEQYRETYTFTLEAVSSEDISGPARSYEVFCRAIRETGNPHRNDKSHVDALDSLMYYLGSRSTHVKGDKYDVWLRKSSHGIFTTEGSLLHDGSRYGVLMKSQDPHEFGTDLFKWCSASDKWGWISMHVDTKPKPVPIPFEYATRLELGLPLRRTEATDHTNTCQSCRKKSKSVDSQDAATVAHTLSETQTTRPTSPQLSPDIQGQGEQRSRPSLAERTLLAATDTPGPATPRPWWKRNPRT